MPRLGRRLKNQNISDDEMPEFDDIDDISESDGGLKYSHDDDDEHSESCALKQNKSSKKDEAAVSSAAGGMGLLPKIAVLFIVSLLIGGYTYVQLSDSEFATTYAILTGGAAAGLLFYFLFWRV